MVKKKAKEFFIDLMAGPDVAFRLNARFPSRVSGGTLHFWSGVSVFVCSAGKKIRSPIFQKLLCNTKMGDEWQTPEKLSLEPFPFRRKVSGAFHRRRFTARQNVPPPSRFYEFSQFPLIFWHDLS